jgi:alkylation response protein AidB-like acyl-CoA dehydrogenase
MSKTTTRPGEIGVLAADSIRQIADRAASRSNITSYAERESPLAWDALQEGGWDLIGIPDDDSPENGAELRDLVEIARAWGNACLPLPLIPSILAKRHSEAAREVDGPVTFALPSSTRSDSFFTPYGQFNGIQFAHGLGAGDDRVTEVPAGEPDHLDLLMRGRGVSQQTAISPSAAREIAVVMAAEAAGAATRLLNEGIGFVKEREQFGKPIGTFQAVKHHLANALIATELAETAVIWASKNEAEAFRGSLYALNQSIAAAELVLQVHGGIGFTWELGLHFYLRRMISARELVSGIEAQHA